MFSSRSNGVAMGGKMPPRSSRLSLPLPAVTASRPPPSALSAVVGLVHTVRAAVDGIDIVTRPIDAVLKLRGTHAAERCSTTSGRPGGGTLTVNCVVWTSLSPFPAIINKCNQKPDFMTEVHQIKFRLELRPKRSWGAYEAPPHPVVVWGGEHPLPRLNLPQRLRRLARLSEFPHCFLHNLSTA